jgi:hypothetical protein
MGAGTGHTPGSMSMRVDLTEETQPAEVCPHYSTLVT